MTKLLLTAMSYRVWYGIRFQQSYLPATCGFNLLTIAMQDIKKIFTDYVPSMCNIGP